MKWFQGIVSSLADKRCERLRRKLRAQRDATIKQLRERVKDLEVQLERSQIELKYAHDTIQHQELLIERERERVRKEIRDMGGKIEDKKDELHRHTPKLYASGAQ